MNQTEMEHLLLENLKVSRETRDYVRGIYRQQKWTKIRKVIQWIIFLALLGVAYWFLAPYLRPIKDTITEVSSSVSSFTGSDAKMEQ